MDSNILESPIGVALSGKFCTGKDYTANFLTQVFADYSYAVLPEVKLLSFAGALKSLAELHHLEEYEQFLGIGKFVEQFNILSNQKGALIGRICHYFDTIPKQLGKNRELLQILGTGCREIYPDIWINALKNTIDPAKINIITDMRFTNEVEFAKKERFLTVRLTCAEVVRLKRAADLGYKITKDILDHPSETDLDSYKDFDYMFDTTNGLPPDIQNLIYYIILTKNGR